MRELENYQPLPDAETEAAWRDGLRNQFAATMTAERAKTQQLSQLSQQRNQHHQQPDIDLLETVPVGVADLTRLPEDHQRRLFDAFHLEVRYNALAGEIILRASVHADTAPALAAVIDQVINPSPPGQPHRRTGNSRTHQERSAGEADAFPASNDGCHAQSAPGGIRTHTVWILSPSALPLAYRGATGVSVPISLVATTPRVSAASG